MTHYRMIRMGWAATAVAGASAIAYLTLMPMTGSQLADVVLSAAVVTIGAVVGAVAAYRIETAILDLRPRTVPESYPSAAKTLARVS